MMEEANKQLEVNLRETQNQIREKDKLLTAEEERHEKVRRNLDNIKLLVDSERAKYDLLAKQRKDLEGERDRLKDTKLDLVTDNNKDFD